MLPATRPAPAQLCSAGPFSCSYMVFPSSFLALIRQLHVADGFQPFASFPTHVRILHSAVTGGYLPPVRACLVAELAAVRLLQTLHVPSDGNAKAMHVPVWIKGFQERCE